MATTSLRSPANAPRRDPVPDRLQAPVPDRLPAPSANPRSNAMPPPFPEGWYLVATRDEIQREQLLEKQWLGEQIIAWCDDEGQICVSDAFCPHLGSHLGPEAGGRVCDGKLVCPFHGFEFEIGGQCVATPSAAPPRSARLELYQTRELAGMIFAWYGGYSGYGAERRPPQWQLPEPEPDQAGWSGLQSRTTRLRGHPQETTENAVDLAHLSYVHGFDQVQQVGTVSVEGPVLRTAFNFTQRIRYAGVPLATFDISAEVTIVGLGYSFVEVHERSIGIDMRLWTLATPVDGTQIDLTLVSQVREIRPPQTPDRRYGIPADLAAHPPDEPALLGAGIPRRPPGQGHLVAQEVPPPPPPLPLRRRDHGLPSLVRPVLPRSRPTPSHEGLFTLIGRYPKCWGGAQNLRHTRACRGYLAPFSTDPGGSSEIAAACPARDAGASAAMTGRWAAGRHVNTH